MLALEPEVVLLLIIYTVYFKRYPSAQYQVSTSGFKSRRERRERTPGRQKSAEWRKEAPVIVQTRIRVKRVCQSFKTGTLPPGEQAFSAGEEKAQ